MEIYAISQQKNQKSKRRERAQRMQAEKDIDIVGGGEVDSGEDDDYETLKRDKTVRPPVRRKRSKDSSPILEEDIIDGFAILAFKSYEDLEFAIKLASKRNEKRLSSITELTELMAEEKPEKQQGKSKSESKSKNLPDESYQKNQAKAYINQSVYAHQDAGTSDDSGRASERLTASSVAQRDAESSRDRLSDASSRCSSGKGYICDSEGDDDKASETGSIVFSNAIGKHNTQNCNKREDASNDISNYREPIKDEPTHNESNSMEVTTNAAQTGKPTGNAVPTLETTTQNCVPNSTSHILMHDNVGDKLNRSPLSCAPADPEATKILEEKRPHSNSNVNTENTNNIAIAHNDLGQQEPFNFKTEITKTPPLRSPSKVFSIPSIPSHIVSSQPYHNEQKPEIFSLTSSSSASSSAHPPYRATYPGFSTFTPYSCTTLSSPDMSQKPNRIHEMVPGKPVQELIEQTDNLNNAVHMKSGSPGISKLKPVSPRISSPFKERDCFSESGTSSANNVPGTSQSSNNSLHTDTSVSTTNSLTQPKVISAASWSQMSTQEQAFLKVSPSVGLPRPTPPPTITSAPSIITQPPASTSHPTPTTTAPLSFSAESLFSSSKSKDQTDMLRRELDTRFLSSAGPYLRQELHHHQHQHTHLHQHHQQIISAVPPTTGSIFPPPLFKEIPKIGGVDSPFYRTGIGMPMYPGYPPTLLHPNIGTATQFVPPTHLAGYMQKKPGRWNAIHVRIAWEIYYHQSKQNPDRSGHIKATDMLRPPTHVHPPTGNMMRGHELVQGSYTSSASVLGGRSVFETGIPTSYLGTSSHMGLSPFSRYSAPFASYNSISPYARDPTGYPALHDPWRSLQRGYLPSSAPSANWGHKPDPGLEISKRENEERERQLREREERERQRREREEKERQKEREREREEKLKKEQQERERKEKEKREFERREMERERMLQQQRMNESCKASAVLMHDARGNALRNGMEADIRIKEENRKEEELMARDVRYVAPSTSLLNPPPHTYLTNKHPSHLLPGPHLSRSMGMPPTGPPMPHFPPPPNVWPGIDPYRDYRLDSMAPLRYNPLMEAFRVEEERAKAYAHSALHYRQKESQPFPLLHHRMPSNPIKPPNSAMLPSVNLDGHKKEDPSPSR